MRCRNTSTFFTTVEVLIENPRIEPGEQDVVHLIAGPVRCSQPERREEGAVTPSGQLKTDGL